MVIDDKSPQVRDGEELVIVSIGRDESRDDTAFQKECEEKAIGRGDIAEPLFPKGIINKGQDGVEQDEKEDDEGRGKSRAFLGIRHW